MRLESQRKSPDQRPGFFFFSAQLRQGAAAGTARRRRHAKSTPWPNAA